MPFWLILAWHVPLTTSLALPRGEGNQLLVLATLGVFFTFFYADYYSLQKYVRGLVVVYYLTLALELRWPASIALNVSLLVYQIAFAVWFRVGFWKIIVMVLTGVLAGLLGQGLSDLRSAETAGTRSGPFETSSQFKFLEQVIPLGVYLHGLAGDLAAKTQGEKSLVASDIMAHLPEAFRKLEALHLAGR